ncbi:ArsR family transcriptional regulator [Amycolatopsis lurida]
MALPSVRVQQAGVQWHASAYGDRRVRELVDAVGQPQNLVSYHLRKLRTAELVTARRSSFDGRDTYYHLDLTRCADALAETGIALHPGLAPGQVNRTRSTARLKVLFVCTGNSGRSPMAAALLRHRAGPSVEVFSAGSAPKPLHSEAVRALAEYRVPLTHEPTHVDSLRRRRFHWVITLCDRAREVCPEFPGHPRLLHWSLPDPAREADDAGETLPAFRRLAGELDRRIGFLLSRFGVPVEAEGQN